ncbi:MAG: transporter [Desulfotalea sp.]|nr:MAG: transporter [Desulfotalea sp.]
MIVLNSLFPIFVLLLFGRFLKSRGLTNSEFLKTSDRLIYYVFFPVMLFWKIGGSSFAGGIDWLFVMAGIAPFFAMFLFSAFTMYLCKVSSYQAGSFSQSCYRFNTYIGVAVVLNSMGNEGVRYLGLLIGFVIPLVNLFAVFTLIWFSGEKLKIEQRFVITLRTVVSNPMIIGCVAGVVYSQTFGYFPTFIDNSLALISMVALPLALVSVGGGLTFSGLRGHFKLSLVGAILKLFVLPVFGYGFFCLFGVTGVPLKVGLIFLALPASTAIYVLSSQLHSDTELASASIFLSTILSFISLSVVLLL